MNCAEFVYVSYYFIRNTNSAQFIGGSNDLITFAPEQNSTKLDKKQDLNVLWQVCVFRADWNGSHGFWLAKKSNLKRKYYLYSSER